MNVLQKHQSYVRDVNQCERSSQRDTESDATFLLRNGGSVRSSVSNRDVYIYDVRAGGGSDSGVSEMGLFPQNKSRDTHHTFCCLRITFPL